MTVPVGRLAPTPSGELHLGNVVAFLAAWLSVRAAGGRLLLRIEDVDTARARAEVEASLRADLRWLGLEWDAETRRQSARDYRPWLKRLSGSVYRCACTRADVQEAGGRYPGTCRDRALDEGSVRFRLPDALPSFVDRRFGRIDYPEDVSGDPVLRRRDGVFTYPLAVVADDVEDGVTEVVRGADLLSFTAVQICLWRAFGVPPPTWLHVPLVLGPDGRKLSKSHGALHVGALRAAGWTPADVLRLTGAWLGLDGVASLDEAVTRFDPAAGLRGPLRLTWASGTVPPPGAIRWEALDEGEAANASMGGAGA